MTMNSKVIFKSFGKIGKEEAVMMEDFNGIETYAEMNKGI